MSKVEFLDRIVFEVLAAADTEQLVAELDRRGHRQVHFAMDKYRPNITSVNKESGSVMELADDIKKDLEFTSSVLLIRNNNGKIKREAKVSDLVSEAKIKVCEKVFIILHSRTVDSLWIHPINDTSILHECKFSEIQSVLVDGEWLDFSGDTNV